MSRHTPKGWPEVMTHRTPEGWAEGPHTVGLCPDLTAEDIRRRTTDVWGRVCVARDKLGATEEALFATASMRHRVYTDMLVATEEMERRADQEGVPRFKLGEDMSAFSDAVDNWLDNWGRCRDYDLATMAKAATAEGAKPEGGDLWDAHAFIMRWGTTDELGTKDFQLVDLWWWWANRLVSLADLEAMAGLAKAFERLAELRWAAKQAEATLRAHGYALDPETRLLKEVGKRGPRRRVLAAKVTETFDHLVEKNGGPLGNTDAVRQEIADRLANLFHPALLDPAKGGELDHIINNHLNLNRDHATRRKRGGKKRG